MKFLTTIQKQWMVRKTIKVGESYMFPRFGFEVYAQPNYESGVSIDTNPFTKSLDKESFLVKEITPNGFCKGNFAYKPKGADWYLSEEELSRRGLTEMLFLLVITFIPLSIYNYCKGGAKKMESKA